MQDPDLLRVVLDAVRDGVVITDVTGRVQWLNAAAQAMTGWSCPDAVGLPVEDVIDLRAYGSDQRLVSPVYAALRSNEKSAGNGHQLLLGRDGRRLGVDCHARPYAGADGTLAGSLLVFYDVSEAQRLAERMAYLSQQDPLTGLPNRLLLVDRLEQATRIADRTRESLAVLFVDLDGFHAVNTSLGQAIGDQLLKQAAYRISEALRESDTVCRLGGDEFVVLLLGVRSQEDVEALAEKLLVEIARPYRIGEHAVEVGASIGVSMYPKDASDAETLMRKADGAMHIAKQSGRGRVVFTGADGDAIRAKVAGLD
jgi:diguanylate cyclase (GGDEF)-like protein/PAS domain S-box-containing protein